MLDSLGMKDGYWIEKTKDFKVEVYYKKNKKNGIEKIYYRNGVLMAFLNYQDGKLIETGFFFNEEGRLDFTVKYIEEIKRNKNILIKGYYTIYNKKGKIKRRGLGLSSTGDEYEMEEIGNWEKFDDK